MPVAQAQKARPVADRQIEQRGDDGFAQPFAQGVINAVPLHVVAGGGRLQFRAVHHPAHEPRPFRQQFGIVRTDAHPPLKQIHGAAALTARRIAGGDVQAAQRPGMRQIQGDHQQRRIAVTLAQKGGQQSGPARPGRASPAHARGR